MDKLLLPSEYLEILKSIFNTYAQNSSVLAYGSRLSGDAHSGSDLDLALVKHTQDTINFAEIREAISDSNIPFFVDLFDYSSLPKSYQDEIQKNNVKIY